MNENEFNYMKKIVIFGAGDGSKEILKVIIEEINKVKISWEFLGFIDNGKDIRNNSIYGYPVYDSVKKFDIENLYGTCGVMNNSIRKKILSDEILGNGLKLASLVHPSVLILPGLTFAEGVIIYPGVNISHNVKIGTGVIVNYNCVIGHDSIIGNYSYLSPSATINGNCKVGKFCTIGSSSTLLQGISIDENSTVGIGTTVLDDVEKDTQIIDLGRKIITKK